ncbi:MAG TPA: cupin domain-containing protein [Opitutaceae bacterium]
MSHSERRLQHECTPHGSSTPWPGPSGPFEAWPFAALQGSFNNMTTVAHATDLAHAQLLKSVLEGAGIAAVIPDELTAQNAPPYVWASGGLRVQVLEADAAAARAVLASEPGGAAPLVAASPPSPGPINLDAKLALFREHWSPKIIAALNGQHVKLVKFQGPFLWHQHEHEDELFYVLHGSFRMEFRERTVELRAGEMIVVPRGVEHRPVADAEVSVLLFEPASTVNTGSAGGERTVAAPAWI